MADFPIGYKVAMGHEGGYAKHPSDTGGETWRGISRNNWPKWKGWIIVDQIKKKVNAKVLRDLNRSLAEDKELDFLVKDFYKKNFWDVYSLDYVKSQTIANEIFEAGVNFGIEVESKFLQRALNLTNRAGRSFPNLKVDGDIGAKTIAVLNAHPNPSLVLKILNVLQGARYISICENNESQEVFAESWFSRVSI